MAPPRKGTIRTVCYFKPEFKAQLLKESKDRKIPMGEVIEEAFAQRVRLIRK